MTNDPLQKIRDDAADTDDAFDEFMQASYEASEALNRLAISQQQMASAVMNLMREKKLSPRDVSHPPIKADDPSINPPAPEQDPWQGNEN